ncbi:hypothetical protein LCGC14_0891750 [marine sediment metagenome]|uniref:Uncharacterized protein n=1 Tax=marine sediment metagenome TaxID=412755 RepID=A0A0F9P3V4_9ZZZZ
MAEITTHTTNATELLPPGLVCVRLTTTTTSDTWVCPYFQELISVVPNNETDNDGVGIGVSGRTITIKPTTAGDIISLLIMGRG